MPGPNEDFFAQRDIEDATRNSGEWGAVLIRVGLGAITGAAIAAGICIGAGEEINLTGVLGTAFAGGILGLATTAK